VRLKGYVDQGLAENEYGRIRVRSRFDIVLPYQPTLDNPLTVNRLFIVKGRLKRRPAGRGRRAA
jgi:hypothetical protein